MPAVWPRVYFKLWGFALTLKLAVACCASWTQNPRCSTRFSSKRAIECWNAPATVQRHSRSLSNHGASFRHAWPCVAPRVALCGKFLMFLSPNERDGSLVEFNSQRRRIIGLNHDAQTLDLSQIGCNHVSYSQCVLRRLT